MAEDDPDQESKTEDPTEKRLEDARKKGQVPTSREVGTALMFLASVLVFLFQGNALWTALQGRMRFLLSGNFNDDITTAGVVLMIRELTGGIMLDLAPFFLIFLLMALLGPLLQHGWLISLEPIKPKLSKINPLQGLKRLFSLRSLVELLKSLLKMAVVGAAVYWGLRDSGERVLLLSDGSIHGVVLEMGNDLIAVLWRVALAFLLLALLDYLYQKYEHIKNLRMTVQEVKDEYKQVEGDPQIKGRIRQIQREMAQRRMMQEVPKADVIITNPTHYSVALRYEPGKMQAPQVVAKGRNELALRIRELAKEHGVPLVENPPLARTLYRDVELEQSIPGELFKAVAEVLAYVYRLKGRGGASGGGAARP